MIVFDAARLSAIAKPCQKIDGEAFFLRMHEIQLKILLDLPTMGSAKLRASFSATVIA